MRLAPLLFILLVAGCAAGPPRSSFYGDPLSRTAKPCLQIVTADCVK